MDRLKLACASLLTLALAPSAFADAIVGEMFSATLNSYAPATAVNVTSATAGSLAKNVGVLNWTVVDTFTTSTYFAPGNTFHGFCIELNQQVGVSTTYLFTTTALKDAPKPGVGVGTGNGMGQTKADLITELYDRFYEGTLLTDGTGTEAAAFQLAIWNIIYDADVSVTSLAGTFFSNTAPVSDVAGTVPFRANEMLTDLAGLGSVQRTWDLFAISSQNFQDNVVAVRVPSTPTPIGAGMGLIGFALIGLRRQRGRA